MPKSKHAFYAIKKIVGEQADKWKCDYRCYNNYGLETKLAVVEYMA